MLVAKKKKKTVNASGQCMWRWRNWPQRRRGARLNVLTGRREKKIWDANICICSNVPGFMVFSKTSQHHRFRELC